MNLCAAGIRRVLEFLLQMVIAVIIKHTCHIGASAAAAAGASTCARRSTDSCYVRGGRGANKPLF